MFPNYFKYSRKDLNKKFKQMIETNKMISEKSNKNIEIPRSKIFRENNENNCSFFSDIKDISSTNISALMKEPDESFINYVLLPFEHGFKFNDINKLLIFKKKSEDEFFNYKQKIYDVI